MGAQEMAVCSAELGARREKSQHNEMHSLMETYQVQAKWIQGQAGAVMHCSVFVKEPAKMADGSGQEDMHTAAVLNGTIHEDPTQEWSIFSAKLGLHSQGECWNTKGTQPWIP